MREIFSGLSFSPHWGGRIDRLFKTIGVSPAFAGFVFCGFFTDVLEERQDAKGGARDDDFEGL